MAGPTRPGSRWGVPPGQGHLLVVRAGGAPLALPLAAVAAVLPRADPGAPRGGWVGSVSWRTDDPAAAAAGGRPVPVAAATALLGLPEQGPAAATVVLRTPAGPVGLAVERVEGARPVPAGRLEPLPAPARGGHAELLAGLSCPGGSEPFLLVLAERRLVSVLAGSLAPGALPRPLPVGRLARLAPPVTAPTSGEAADHGDELAGGPVLEVWLPGPEGDLLVGLPLARVLEVGWRPRAVPLPRGALPLDGLALWQERPVPLLSLDVRFGWRAASVCQRAVLVETGDRGASQPVWLAVDRFGAIVSVPRSALRRPAPGPPSPSPPAPPLPQLRERGPGGEGTVLSSRLLLGVADHRTGRLPVLDVRAAVRPDELVVDAPPAASAGERAPQAAPGPLGVPERWAAA